MDGTADEVARWFPTAGRAGSGVPLICFPHSGAGAGAYRAWPRALGTDVAVLPVQLPGRENRFGEPLLTGVGDVTERLAGPAAALVREPCVLFGHSMGALLAYEFAHVLTRIGAPPAHLVISGHPAPQLSRTGPSRRSAPDHELAAYLRSLGGPGPSAFEDPELMELFLPIVRADFTVCETYVHTTRAPLSVPITVLSGDADPTVPTGSLEPWRDLTTATTTIETFPGGHFYLDVHLEAVLGHICTARV